MLILRHPIDALSGALLLLVLELVSLNGIGHLTGPYEISGVGTGLWGGRDLRSLGDVTLL